MTLTLGSLFDGSGGFPLAGSKCGIEPLWAAEVEPYPIAVTCSRFPLMEHLGSVTEVNGAEVEPVDIITFGSPCQDLSVAGKRAGLKHEVNGDDETTRSGLFMEAVRIIREMREATNGDYPKWAVWENVPGAFSSNKGEDFRIVLEELIKTVEPNAVMPPVPKNGWPYADCYYGDGWSLAYRVFDAQFWGVPQRRRRIYLVLDLTGQRAGSVLFEREGVRGYFETGRTPWQAAAGDAGGRVETADREGAGDGIIDGTSSTTRAAGFKANQGAKAGGIGWQEECACTLSADRPGLEPTVCYSIQGNTIDRDAKQNGCGICEDVSHTLNAVDRHGVAFAMQGFGDYKVSEVASGMKARDYKDATDLVVEEAPIVLDRAFYNQGQNAQYEPQFYTDGTVPTLVAKGPSAVCHKVREPVRYIVRRLTPTECARLQGFPDEWGHPVHMDTITDEDYRFWLNVRKTHAAINGKAVKDYTREQIMNWYNKLHTDSSEYKMWGNGIALPCALYVLEGIAEVSKTGGDA